jgi:hypothetical protein
MKRVVSSDSPTTTDEALAAAWPSVAAATQEATRAPPGDAVVAPDPLDEPAGAFLARIPWQGLAPDPDRLDARSFLALL